MAIDRFNNEYRWLSNMAECRIRYGPRIFSSVEAAYQASKCTSDVDRDRFVGINGLEAKRLSRQLKLVPLSEVTRLSYMELFLFQKFLDEPFYTLLLNTGNEKIIEGNHWHDNFWGNCTCPKCADIPGRNELGKLIMKIRGRV